MLNIQEELDNASARGEVALPAGEYEGPFYVRKPCRVSGGSATLWANKGPVITVESDGVSLGDLRIEVTGDPADKDGFVAIRTTARDTKLNNIEVLGNISGFTAEGGDWRVPRVLHLGEFAPGVENLFLLDIYAAGELELAYEIADIEISPLRLHAGMNQIRLKTGKIKDKTIIFGELIFKSFVSHRVYISGKSVRGGADCSAGKTIFADKPPSVVQTQALSAYGSAGSGAQAPPDKISPNGIIAPQVSDPEVISLTRGQRIAFNEYKNAEIKLVYEQKDASRPMEIDVYIFMLGKDNKVFGDDDLIFFGNTESADHSVKCLSIDDKQVSVFLPASVDPKFDRVSLAYSIYGNDKNNNFSKIVEPSVRIIINGRDKYRFQLKDLTLETTVTALEFYRYKGEWKLSAVGAGYINGLRPLCESFGVEIES